MNKPLATAADMICDLPDCWIYFFNYHNEDHGYIANNFIAQGTPFKIMTWISIYYAWPGRLEHRFSRILVDTQFAETKRGAEE